MRKIALPVWILVLLIAISSCGEKQGASDEIELIPVKFGRQFQYIDYAGKIVINPQFEKATAFRNGLALVKTPGRDGRYGYIKPDGQYAMQPVYKQATVFSEGLAWVVEEASFPVAINPKGEKIISLQNAEAARAFSDGLAAYSMVMNDGLLWGFLDATGKSLIKPTFKECGDFSEGMCAVRNDQKQFGYIDKTGKLVVPFQFEKAEAFEKGVAAVRVNRKWGLIDKNGNFLINPYYEELSVDNDKCLVRMGYRWGWTDHKGTVLINPQFFSATPFGTRSTAAVQNELSWGYVNASGQFEINPQFDQALPFLNGVAGVFARRKAGFINEEGKYIINPQFDGIADDYVLDAFGRPSKEISVKTDFFNIAAIVSRIDPRAPEGLQTDATFAELIAKSGLTENTFSKYASRHRIINGESITDDALLNLEVEARLVDETRQPTLQVPIISFHYTIAMQGRGRNKEANLMDAMEQALAGFSRLDVTADRKYKYRKVRVLTDGTRTVEIEDKYPGVHVNVLLGSPINN